MAKCYVFVCAGCGLLNLADRSDKLTCSPACRVKAHRNGSLEALRARARGYGRALVDERTGKPNVQLLLQAEAVLLLRPDLADEIDAGHMTLAQAQPGACREFMRRLGLVSGRASPNGPNG